MNIFQFFDPRTNSSNLSGVKKLKLPTKGHDELFNMHSVKEFNSELYFVKVNFPIIQEGKIIHSDVLFKYDALKKRFYACYISNDNIMNYFVSDRDEIIVVEQQTLKWLLPSNRNSVWVQKSSNDYDFDFYFWKIRFINTIHGLFVAMRKKGKYLIISYDKKINQYYEIYDISSSRSGQKIIYALDGYIYYKDVYYENMNSLFDNGSKICDYLIQNITWIENSNRLVAFHNFESGIIYNVDVKRMSHNIVLPRGGIDTVLNIFFVINYSDSGVMLKIYDATTFDFKNVIKCDNRIQYYHKRYNIWFNNKFEYYRLTSDLEFKKITMGENYLDEYYYVPNVIMDIILEGNMMFDFVALEIICIDLYGRILHFV